MIFLPRPIWRPARQPAIEPARRIVPSDRPRGRTVRPPRRHRPWCPLYNMADGDVSLDASGNTVLLDTGNECLVPCCVGCANLTHAAVVRCAFSGVTLSSTCVGCSGAEGKINSGTLGTYDTAYATTSSGVDFHQATTAVVGEFCLDHSTSFATVQIKTNCDTDSSALVEVLNGGRRSFRGSFDRCDLLAGAVVVNNEFTATGCIGGTTTATGSGGSVTLTLITP